MALKLYIKDLIVSGKHGFHAHEKEQEQRFKITVELALNNDAATLSDNLKDTINWSHLRDDITAVVGQNSYDLIERLVQEIADTCLKDRRVTRVFVSVDKLDAFPSGTPGITLEIER